MSEDLINYAALIDDAMHVIVKKCLLLAARNRLPGKHHFFISFLTNYKGVQLSEKLRRKYPTEMTIVLQYQFDELQVTDKKFSVVLSFDGVKECVIVPFNALTAFADPSVKFGLQFRYVDENIIEDEDEFFTHEPVSSQDRDDNNPSDNNTAHDNVIKLDQFRKKRQDS
jgi:hypothetical protein